MRLIFTFMLLMLVCTAAQAQTVETSTQELRSGSWYKKARQKIRELEYNIKWKTGLGDYVAMNRKNQVGFYFQQDGYRVVSFSSSENNNWEFGFRLKGIQRAAYNFPASSLARTEQSGNELVYHYPQFAIEYRNDTIGMRQNFIINERLGGKGMLEVVIRLEGSLETALNNEKGLVLSSVQDHERKTVLSYDQLKVWDHNNRPLEAAMELRDGGKTLVLAVDDAQAVYPITVDPLNHTPDWTDNGLGVVPSLDALYGSTVSDAGDVNNDGFDDIIIGAPANIDVLSNSVIASTGKAFIYLGSSSGLSTTPDITLESSLAANALFGFCVSGAGDINNDGYDDVIVGAPGDMVTLNFGIPFGSLSNNIGKAYIYYGNASPASIPGSVVNLNLRVTDFLGATFGATTNPLYGYSVSSAGDVNNDGFGDVVIGSPLYTDLGTLTVAGRATIYLGSSGGLNSASPIHRNGALLANTMFGCSVSSAGDMNNDGADEVLIGAPGALSLLPGVAGKAYVYTGISAPAPGGISAAPVTYSAGALLSTLFGYSVSNAGDVNNDGFDDIVVGQPATLSLSGLVTVGQASVFFGTTTLSNKTVSDITLRSPRDPDILSLVNGNLLFGFSVSGGRDFDCDGIDDILVGEPGGTALAGLNGTNAVSGQAYIFFGRNSTGPDNRPGWNLKETGSLTVANLIGYSVSPAGDVNGDGNSDILIGAANGTLDLSNIVAGLINFVFVQSVGSAYVYHGCVTPNLFTLPVTLNNFSGYLQNNNVVLKWKTANEENASRFEIERSVNNMPFETIGVVNVKSDSRTTTDYSYIDKSPQTTTNVYRLKIIDRDGKFTYSTALMIKLEMTGFVRIKSNFVNTAFTLEFNNVSKGDYSIDVISMDGRVLQRDQVKISSGGYTSKVIQTKNAFTKGIYIIRVRDTRGNVSTFRFSIR